MQSTPEHHGPVLFGGWVLRVIWLMHSERAFSTINRIKFDRMCRLGAELLDILMRIKDADDVLREYDPKPAVIRWLLYAMD